MKEYQFTEVKLVESDRNLNHLMVQVELFATRIDHLRLLVESVEPQTLTLKEIKRC